MSGDANANDRDPRLTALIAQLEQLLTIVRSADLDPSPLRSDWAAHRERIDAARRVAVDELLANAEAAIATVQQPEQVSNIRNGCADVLGDVAGLLYAARERVAAEDVLRGAARLGEGTEAGKLAAEGTRDLEGFTRFIRAWWLLRHDRRDEARTLARELADNRHAPAIAASARTIAEAPEPLKRPPTLFTFNGIGVGVLGERDHRGDGTYVTTRYAKLIYIPIVPLDAYRVAPGDEEGSYYFLHREPLSKTARVWRWLVLAAVLTAGIGYAASRHFGSPDYQLSSAIAAIDRDAAGSDGEALLARYEAALGDAAPASVATALPAIEAIVRLASADITEPLTLEQVPRLKRVVRRFESLPRWARGQRGAQPMVARIEALAAQLGEDSEAALDAQIRLLTDARRLVDAGPEGERLAAKQRALRGALAGRIAEQWPLRAIRIHAAGSDDDAAVTAAAALIDKLDDAPSQWLELADALDTWIAAAKRVGGLDPVVQRASERLAAARASVGSSERAELLAGDLAALQAALAAAPRDQELAVAVAQAQRAAGDSEAANTTLTAIGAPGRLVLAAQVALAGVWSDLGRADEAEALLQQVLIDRLPAFEDARAAHAEARGARADRLIADAREGRLPQDLIRRLNAAPEAEQQVLFAKWLEQQLAEDPDLAALLAAYTAAGEVVPVALALGTIQLQRAGGLGGDARAAALAAAEQTFLAIQSEAEGVPSYHLGLGEVYHRLGKHDDGDREFASLLAADEPMLALQVADAYRGLGMSERARELCEKLHAEAPSPVREEAALLRSLLARSTAEGMTWIDRADRNKPFVRDHRLSLEADELMTKGEWDKADRKLAEILKGQLAEAETRGAAANNAAVTMLKRYSCTGQRDMLDEAVRTLEKSRRLQPDSAVVVGNLAGAVDHLAAVGLAAKYIDVQRLPLSEGEAMSVLESLAEGRSRADVRQRIRVDPQVQRALGLHRQTALLAPRRTSPYDNEGAWFGLADNVEALRDLVARVEAVASFDTSDAVAARERYLRGEDDELHQTGIRSQLARVDLKLAAIDRHKHGPTFAAATYLRGESLEGQSLWDGADRAVEAAAAYRLAREVWPELGTGGDETRALALAAAHRAAAASPEFAALWKKDLRRVGLTDILVSLAREPNSAAAAALRAAPEFTRAVTTLRERRDDEVHLTDWAVAAVAGDAALVERTRATLPGEARRLSLQLTILLHPGDERARELVAHLDAIAGTSR